MRTLLLFAMIFSFNAWSHDSGQKHCEPDLLSSEFDNPMIQSLLREKGEELNATMIGIFEVQLQGGETMLSQLYWSEDPLGRPVEKAQIEAFMSRLKYRAHGIKKVNLWLYAPQSGGWMKQDLTRSQTGKAGSKN